MKKLIIREPIWKDRSVGISTEHDGEDIEVEIIYCVSTGMRLYPDYYRMTKEKVSQYPIMPKSGKRPPLRIIPIKDFEVITNPINQWKQQILTSSKLPEPQNSRVSSNQDTLFEFPPR